MHQGRRWERWKVSMRRKRLVRLVTVAMLLVAAGALFALAAEGDGIIYEEDAPMAWRWRQDGALPDQYLALVLDAADLQLLELALPTHVWENHQGALTAQVQDAGAAVVAYLGEAPTGGYAIGVRQVRVDRVLPRPVVTVVVDRRSPGPGEFVTMAITHPLDIVPIERELLPEAPFLVRFVDGQGRRLAEQRVTVASTAVPAVAPPVEINGDLRVTGYGEVTAAPDRATVSFAVVGRAETAPEAQQIMNDQLASTLRSLRSFGLSDDAIRTRQFSLNPRWRYDSGETILVGYEARTQMEVHLDELDRLGALVQTLVNAGVTEVGRISYGLKDTRAVQEAALREAARDARWRAETLAQALDQRIVGVVEVYDQSAGSPQPMPVMMRATMAMDEAMAAPEFPADELTIRAQVVVLFRLAPR